MRVVCRRGPPHRVTKKVPVVVEIWMTTEEAGHVHQTRTNPGGGLPCGTIQECIEEHLTNGRFRANRDVKP